MPLSFATKLGIQFARYAAASGNASSAGFRQAFTNATAGSSSTASSSSWAQGLSSSGSAANGAGVGGAKFQAGRGAHSSFSQSGRAIANANASSSQDAASSYGDDEDELAQQARIHRPGQLHRSGLLGRKWSQSHGISLVRTSRARQTTTTLPALQLILPRGTQLVHSNGSSQQARLLTTSAATSSASASDAVPEGTADHLRGPLEILDAPEASSQTSLHTDGPRRHLRSHSVGESERPKFENDPVADLLFAIRQPQVEQTRKSELPIDFALPEEQNRAVEPIKSAVRSNKPRLVLESVKAYCELDRSQQSTKGFNVALYAMLEFRGDKYDFELLYSCYLQMVNAGFRPDAETYGMMVRALCKKDQSIRSHQAGPKTETPEFAQAMTMFNLAHATSEGFPDVMPYNALLKSCSLNGNVRQGCAVLKYLLLQPNVEPSTYSFAHLITCISNDPSKVQDESDAQRQERILNVCKQTLAELEDRRRHHKTKGKLVAPWNALITASTKHGDAAFAVGLVETMLRGGKWSSTSLEAPFPSTSTADALLEGLARHNNPATALQWLEKLIALHTYPEGQQKTWMQESALAQDDSGQVSTEEEVSQEDDAEEDQQRVMPLPSIPTVELVIRRNATNSQNERLVEADAADILSRAMSLGVAVRHYFGHSAWSDNTMSEGYYRRGVTSLRKVVYAQVNSCQGLLKKGCTEEANAILDSSLTLVRDCFEITCTPMAKEPRPSETRACHADLMPALFALFDLSMHMQRVEDGTSVLTYAIECQIRAVDETGGSGPSFHYFKPQLWERVRSMINQAEDGKKLTDVQIRQFVQLIEVALPASMRINFEVSKADAESLFDNYRAVRARVLPVELPLSVAGWNFLIGIMAQYESTAGFVRDEGALPLLDDFASLPKEVREQLALDGLFDVLLRKYAISAKEEMERLGFANATTSASDALSSVSDTNTTSAAEATSESGATSMTTESLLEGYDASSSYTGQATLPALQLIDEDLSDHLIRLNDGIRPRSFGFTQKPDPNRAYHELMAAVEEKGSFPSLSTICQMLVSAGRAGKLDRVHSLYVIGCHIIGAMAGDVEWQTYAWPELENGMICALAHAGEAKAASEHRHRLIKAGRVPSVDAYAALIAVVRDTTDDALIAEELYEESQRLGVEPNVFLYNTVISKLCRARKLDRAAILFNEMRQRGLRPTSITYGSMINGFTRTGDEANAELMFSIMEQAHNFKAKAPPYNTMIQFFVYSSPNRRKALYYYQKLREHGVAPTSYTYKLLLDVHGVVQPVDVAGMETVFGELIADPYVTIEGNHWASVITTHGIKTNDLDKAIAIFEAIPTHLATRKAQDKRDPTKQALPDAVVYEALLNVFLTHGRTDLMQEYAQRMRNSGIKATAYLANVMIQGLAAQPTSENVESASILQARALFEEMNDPPMGVAAAGNHPVNHRHHANEGASTTAFPAFDNMPSDHSSTANSFGFRGVLREPSTFETMIRVELQHGHVDAAQTLVNRMRARGYPPALMTKAYALVNAAEGAQAHA